MSSFKDAAPYAAEQVSGANAEKRGLLHVVLGPRV